ncbi:MAG TPA: hypothetical protein VGN12_18980 [Pirellulales bacterium]
MNRRVIEWIVLPTCLAMILCAEFHLIASRNRGAVPFMAFSAMTLGLGVTKWRLENARFWFRMHGQIFDHSRNHLDARERQEWFAQVRHWMAAHGLAGRGANRFLYSRHEHESLARMYDIVVRRASGQMHRRPRHENANLPCALQAEYLDIDQQLEALRRRSHKLQ